MSALATARRGAIPSISNRPVPSTAVMFQSRAPEKGSRTTRSRSSYRSVILKSRVRSSMTSESTTRDADGQTVTIVGSGRIGSALADMSPFPTKVIKRGEAVSGADQGPVFVCTRNNDMEAVVASTPANRREDLVFLQNGMIYPWLGERRLAENTQALIYFGVAKLGDRPADGITDVDPNGLTAGLTFLPGGVIKAGDLTCKSVDKTTFLSAMLEKLIWICSLMPVGTKYGVSVGEVVQNHKAEVTALMEELAKTGERALGIPVSDIMVERLIAYSNAVASFPCAVKEFEWRNGWFYQMTQDAISKGETDPCPLHTAILKEAGAI